jgi:hypothetical protein
VRYEFLLYFLAISQVDPVDTVYTEGTDRTLLGTILVRAVYWSGVIMKLCTCFVLERT